MDLLSNTKAEDDFFGFYYIIDPPKMQPIFSKELKNLLHSLEIRGNIVLHSRFRFSQRKSEFGM